MRQRLFRLALQLWLPALLFALTSGPIEAASAQPQKQVLVVYSERRDAQIVAIGERELPRILEDGLGSVDYYSEYIDRSRFPKQAYQSAFKDFLRIKYKDVRFDAVITIGDAALFVVSGGRQELFPDTPLIYFVASPARDHIENATGLVASPNLSDTLEFIADLQPLVRQIFVVSGTAATDKELESLARQQFRPFGSRFEITYLSGLPSGQLDSRVSTLPANSALYYLVVSRDGNSENVNPLEYLQRLAAIANAPIYCWVDSAMGLGIVGGSLKDQTVQLEAVGRLALRVLWGESADSIPVSSPNLNVREVDWRQLRRWGISESRVPRDTRALFKELSVWDRYKVYILGAGTALLAQTLLIAGLLVQRRRRRQAEEQVRGSEEALRTSYERIRDLGARLLHAQDTERSRVARELHDDISQQIALLSIDLELLSGAVSPDTEGLAGEALDRVHGIARSVHDLSHRLHPAKLRLIGLVAAIQALQRELAQSGPTITFTHEHVPSSLPTDLTVSLFRIVQEALQNAIKHSRAHTIRIDLRGGSDDLALTFSDDGVGFDVDEAWGKGLGLMSIFERTEAIGGTLDIQSRSGGGTSITIMVPLESREATADGTGGPVV